MPFYEYQCKSCGHALEAMQKINDAPLKKCPHCGKSQLQRLMSAPVFRLKGGGWYETDFKGDQDNKRNLADRPETSEEKPKDAAKDSVKEGAESKTEAAPKEAPASDTGAEKPAAKEIAAKKPENNKRVDLAKRAGRGKPAAKKPVKKPPAKAKRRR
jgi:putative FmdB family regulatory protein